MPDQEEPATFNAEAVWTVTAYATHPEGAVLPESVESEEQP